MKGNTNKLFVLFVLCFCLCKADVNLNQYIVLSPEVQQGIANKRPIVALESTIISHGMPYPQNLETAMQVEDIVRFEGAVPATIAILDGKIHIGLQHSELETLAKLGHDVIKTSRRDLAYVLSTKKPGATTVSTTALIAHFAGIKVFVTGGIGGVHRHGESTMDISADLREIGRTPVAVVCAGAKSILDIGRTLEYLETEGVPVIGYNTNDFPAFFSPSSGYAVSARLNNSEQIARMIATSHKLGLEGGMVVGVPIPKEDAGDYQAIEDATQQALREADEQGIKGKEVTPFLLQRVKELTGGDSLRANIALVKNNAKIGSRIAYDLAMMLNKEGGSVTSNVGYAAVNLGDFAKQQDYVVQHEVEEKKKEEIVVKKQEEPKRKEEEAKKVEEPKKEEEEEKKQEKAEEVKEEEEEKEIEKEGDNIVREGTRVSITIIGGAVVDIIGKSNASIIMGDSNPGMVKEYYGGVARNVAETMSRLGVIPKFISVVGNDTRGNDLLNYCKKAGMNVDEVKKSSKKATATYNAILGDDGDMKVAIADMSIFHEITSDTISKSLMPQVFIDGNLPVSTIEYISKSSSKVWFEPTSVPKAKLVAKASTLKGFTWMSPNGKELIAIVREIDHKFNLADPTDYKGYLPFIEALLKKARIHNLIIKLGSDGVLLVSLTSFDSNAGVLMVNGNKHYWAHYKAPNVNKLVSVTGAGDSLAGATFACLYERKPIDVCVNIGIMAAKQSLESEFAVSPLLKPELLKSIVSVPRNRG